MIEITSPGLLPPSIDYSAMGSRQSDARNKVIAPVFKRMGIIDQWGNGLKLVAEEMKHYPEIELRWNEVGLSFQVQFVKKVGGKVGGKAGGKAVAVEMYKDKILALIAKEIEISIGEIAENIGVSKRKCERLIAELKEEGILSRIGSPRSGKWQINTL